MPKDYDRRVPASECTLTSGAAEEVRGYLNGRDGAFGGTLVPFPGTDPMSPLDPEPPRGGSGPRWPIPYL